MFEKMDADQNKKITRRCAAALLLAPAETALAAPAKHDSPPLPPLASASQ